MSENEKADSMNLVSDEKTYLFMKSIELWTKGAKWFRFAFDIESKTVLTDWMNPVVFMDSISFKPASSEIGDAIAKAGFVISIGQQCVKIGDAVFKGEFQWEMDTKLESTYKDSDPVIRHETDLCGAESIVVVARVWKFWVDGVFTVHARQVVR